MANNLHLIVKDRDRGKIYEGDIELLSASNANGTFDIMPDHAQFISLVDRSIRIIHTDGRVQEMSVVNGVLKVMNNTIYVYVGIKKS